MDTITAPTLPIQPEDTPVVLAYRVGKLEVAVSTGLEKVSTQLVTLQHDFATKTELAGLRRDAETEHADIRNDIKEVDKKVDGLNKKRWVQNTLSAILGAVITLLLGYFITNIGK